MAPRVIAPSPPWDRSSAVRPGSRLVWVISSRAWVSASTYWAYEVRIASLSRSERSRRHRTWSAVRVLTTPMTAPIAVATIAVHCMTSSVGNPKRGRCLLSPSIPLRRLRSFQGWGRPWAVRGCSTVANDDDQAHEPTAPGLGSSRPSRSPARPRARRRVSTRSSAAVPRISPFLCAQLARCRQAMIFMSPSEPEVSAVGAGKRHRGRRAATHLSDRLSSMSSLSCVLCTQDTAQGLRFRTCVCHR